MLRRRLPALSLLSTLAAVVAFGPASAQGASFATVAAGADHTCGIRPGGSVYCWGEGRSGQLGRIGAVRQRTPKAVIGSYTATQLTSGNAYFCELLQGGTVSCSGLGRKGQLGTGSNASAQFPQDVVGLPPATRVEAGRATTCALTAPGVYCWGDGGFGQLGDGRLHFDPEPVPLLVPGTANAVDLSVGDQHACMVREGGQVFCWGDTTDGKLGNGRVSAITQVAIPVAGIPDAVQVVAGERHSCAIRRGGTVWCWGNNQLGQLGAGPVPSDSMPVPVVNLGGVTQISGSGSSTTCALRNDGTVWCWGAGRLGQLGNGRRLDSSVPRKVEGLSGAIMVSVGAEHACATTVEMQAYCWGSNRDAQLGNGGVIGLKGRESTPQLVQDALRGQAEFLPTPLASRDRTTRGGSIYLRLFRVTRRGGSCPSTSEVTIRARGREIVRTTKDVEKVKGGCTVTARMLLPTRTQRAFTVVVVVRGDHLKTRKVTLKARRS